MGKKLTIDEVKERLAIINPNIEILDDVYVNVSVKIKCGCKIDGHEWFATWHHLGRGSGCPICGFKKMADKSRHNIDIVKAKLKNINSNIEIMSNEYFGADYKLKCKCLIENCGNEWFVTWGHLSERRGCPSCANKVKGGEGVYNTIIANRNKTKWKNIEAYVYLIKCYNDEEEFYKIGITKNTTRERFKTKINMPYRYKTICRIKTNLYDAIYLESKLHKLNEDFEYIPKLYFAGYTECFSEVKIFENVL